MFDCDFYWMHSAERKWLAAMATEIYCIKFGFTDSNKANFGGLNKVRKYKINKCTRNSLCIHTKYLLFCI